MLMHVAGTSGELGTFFTARQGKKIWDKTTGLYVDQTDAVYANCKIDATEEGDSGEFFASAPAGLTSFQYRRTIDGTFANDQVIATGLASDLVADEVELPATSTDITNRKLVFTIENRNEDDADALEDADVIPVAHITRLDTDEVVVPSDYPTTETVDMVHASTGKYTYTLDGSDAEHPLPVPGVTYRLSYTITVDGDEISDQFDKAAPTDVLPFSDLIPDFNKFVRRFGLKNITYVSDKEATGVNATIQYEVIQDAFDWADAEVYRALDGGPYAVPFTWSDTNVDPCVNEWAMVLAYIHLYEGRFDDEPETDTEAIGVTFTRKKVDGMKKTVYGDMLNVKLGGIRLRTAGSSGNIDFTPRPVSAYDVERTALDDYTHNQN